MIDILKMIKIISKNIEEIESIIFDIKENQDKDESYSTIDLEELLISNKSILENGIKFYIEQNLTMVDFYAINDLYYLLEKFLFIGDYLHSDQIDDFVEFISMMKRVI